DDEERRQRGPRANQGLSLGLVEIEEMFIVSLGICQSFATGTPYAPRISQHLGEINARIECLDVSQSAADYLFCTSVAFGPQKKTLVT
ncbi:hypothetical protein ABTH92_20695, partial [Acinetobacter baumannii]